MLSCVGYGLCNNQFRIGSNSSNSNKGRGGKVARIINQNTFRKSKTANTKPVF